MSVSTERLAFLALHFVPGVGNFLVKQLISYCGSAEAVFQSPKGKLLKIPNVGEVTAQSIKTGAPLREAEDEFGKAQKEGAEILFYTDDKYPSRLREIEDAPSVIYWKGQANLDHAKIVALVGTRQATAYGKKVTERLLDELKPHRALVLSGLAYGIDIQAHKEALKNELPTIAVFGNGLDTIYPGQHRDTAHKMLNHGGWITENSFGTKPDAHNFPARNRIIAGLCDALIVVEASEKGGALITANIANSYNKDVFAVPGPVDGPFSAGCNQLIKSNRANLLTGVADLEYIMGWNAATPEPARSPQLQLHLLSPEEQQIVRLLQEKNAPVGVDEISWRTGIPQGTLASLLLTLEFNGSIKSLPGKMYGLA